MDERPDSLTALENLLRTSIAAELFADAGRLMPLFELALLQQARGLEPGSPDQRDLQLRAGAFFEWAELRVRAFHACAATERERLRLVNSYDAQFSTRHVAVSA